MPDKVMEQPIWLYTQKAEDFVRQFSAHPLTEEKSIPDRTGMWQGRHLIHRDGDVSGGVYLCAGRNGALGEACVVDDQKTPVLNNIYEEMLAEIKKESKETGLPFRQLALERALNVTQKVMPYNKKFVRGVEDRVKPGQKVGLNYYIENHAGVCRHQSLLTAYLIERMIKDGYLRGQVSIDRNQIPGVGGHAWVRYTNSAGEVFILDPAQDFRGTLEEADKNAYWNYRRPEEMDGKKSGLEEWFKQMPKALKPSEYPLAV